MSKEFEFFDNRDLNKKTDASIIVATYNHAWCLDYVLNGLKKQTYKNFEIIIADDGSSDATKDLALKHELFFITQSHNGFRKTRIINEASRFVKSNYIILLDGDCIAHPYFVGAHIESRAKGRYLAGRRIDLPQSVTQKILLSSLDKSIETLILSNFYKIKKINRLFVFKNFFLRKVFNQDHIYDMMGCNGSFWYNDFLEVDGYDERYVRAHREDGDLCARFKHKGLKIKSVKGLALVYHLWHRSQPYYENEDLFNETLNSKRIKAIKGLSSRSGATGQG